MLRHTTEGNPLGLPGTDGDQLIVEDNGVPRLPKAREPGGYAGGVYVSGVQAADARSQSARQATISDDEGPTTPVQSPS